MICKASLTQNRQIRDSNFLAGVVYKGEEIGLAHESLVDDINRDGKYPARFRTVNGLELVIAAPPGLLKDFFYSGGRVLGIDITNRQFEEFPACTLQRVAGGMIGIKDMAAAVQEIEMLLDLINGSSQEGGDFHICQI